MEQFIKHQSLKIGALLFFIRFVTLFFLECFIPDFHKEVLLNNQTMKKTIYKLLSFPLLLLISVIGFSQDKCAVVGWATQGSGVTGGGTATATVVSNYAAFKSAVESSSVKVIHVSGTITFPAAGRVSFQDQSNKSILGLPGSKIVSSDQTKDGSGIMYMKRCSNIIMRNLIFEGPGAYDTDGWDLLALDACTNIWVDHSEFHDGVDGNLDIKNASDLITITWCTFSYEKAPKAGGPGGSDDHRYSNLFGSSDGATGDEGKLRITMQYNWWGEGCKERMPRVRYGKVHMVNNYFSSSVANQGIRAAYKADILAEGNYFISGYTKPIDEFEKNYTAILSKNNQGASDLTKGTAFLPPYTLTITNAADIVAPIKSCAGAKLSSVNGCSSCGGTVVANKAPTTSITSPTSNQQFTGVPATVMITANAADSDGLIKKVEFYNGNTYLGVDDTYPYAYEWKNLAADTYTITSKATDDDGASTVSAAITFKVVAATTTNKAPTVSLTSPTANQQITGAPVAVTIAANAADSDGSIKKVEFYNGNTYLGTDDVYPYTYEWKNVAASTYTITAKATDNLDLVTTSSAISFTVTGDVVIGGDATLTKKGSGSSTQIVGQGEAILAFYYAWENATNVTYSGFPAGLVVVVNTAEKRLDISGTPTQFGEFNFTITTVGGTTEVSKTGKITVNKITGIEDLLATRLAVYPNPVVNELTIAEANNWEVFNTNGQKLSEGNGDKISFESFSRGIYFVKIEGHFQKIIKE